MVSEEQRKESRLKHLSTDLIQTEPMNRNFDLIEAIVPWVLLVLRGSIRWLIYALSHDLWLYQQISVLKKPDSGHRKCENGQKSFLQYIRNNILLWLWIFIHFCPFLMWMSTYIFICIMLFQIPIFSQINCYWKIQERPNYPNFSKELPPTSLQSPQF